MLVSVYYKLNLFNAHAMILIFHIFMNVNKLCLNQPSYYWIPSPRPPPPPPHPPPHHPPTQSHTEAATTFVTYGSFQGQLQQRRPKVGLWLPPLQIISFIRVFCAQLIQGRCKRFYLSFLAAYTWRGNRWMEYLRYEPLTSAREPVWPGGKALGW